MASSFASLTLRNLQKRGSSIVSSSSRSLTNLSSRTSSSSSVGYRGYASTVTAAAAASSTAGQTLAKLAAENPYVEVVRYEHKNVKWTLKHVEHYSDALATGLLEDGLRPGDVMLSWLPDHFAESHILQFACSKAGFVLYNLDPSTAINDPELAKSQLATALEITKANCLFTQEAGDDVNYVNLVKSVIPETRIFMFEEGMPFFTPRFPHLRYPIQTGFDQVDKEGFIKYSHMLVPSGELDNILADAKLDGKTPLLGELSIGSDGLPKLGKTVSNENVVKTKAWPQLASILNKEYTEVEGVGVIF